MPWRIPPRLGSAVMRHRVTQQAPRPRFLIADCHPHCCVRPGVIHDMLNALSAVNFNVDLITPDCSVTLTFETKWYAAGPGGEDIHDNRRHWLSGCTSPPPYLLAVSTLASFVLSH